MGRCREDTRGSSQRIPAPCRRCAPQQQRQLRVRAAELPAHALCGGGACGGGRRLLGPSSQRAGLHGGGAAGAEHAGPGGDLELVETARHEALKTWAGQAGGAAGLTQ